MRELNEIERDALGEILNIGVGHAADSFSRIVNCPVRFSVPMFKLVYGKLAGDDMLFMDTAGGCMVMQSFTGVLKADAICLFTSDGSLALVRAMLGRDIPINEIRELEADALIEVGNNLFNSCISVISNMIGSRFECGMPHYETGRLSDLVSAFDTTEDCLLLMQVEFNVEEVQVQSYIMFLIKVDSVEVFLTAIKKHLGLPA